ncbi:MAG TPA: hypothetical protein VGR37_22475 [Longimicrobiaceae bacterium]|nr:hypothetical protein [Longimicrobiaceae bacterium]
MHARQLLPLLLLTVAACGGPRRAPQPAPAAPPPPPFPHAVVWTREAGTALRPDSAGAPTVALPNSFTRLEVLRSDSASLYVRCIVCTPHAEGWVPKERVVFEARPPALAATGDLAEFLLSVRDAASRRDLAALRPVMARQFTHSLGGGDGVVEAVGRWEQEAFRRFDRLPFLLDRGVATRDGLVWAAPPAWVTDPGYRDLRAGFRREGNRWEWIFLVPGPGES